MNNFFKKYFKGDQVIWTLYIFLCFASALIMYSASSYHVHRTNAAHWVPVMKHIAYLIMGFGFAWLIHYLPIRGIRMLGYVVYALFFICLCLMMFTPLGKEINGALRWLDLKVVPTFQPSEGIKLGLVLVVADLLSRVGRLKDNKVYWLCVMMIFVPCIIIFPSNFSTVALLLVVMFVMLFLSEIDKKWLRGIVPILLGISLCVGGYFLVKATPAEQIPDWAQRVVTWVNRWDRYQEDKHVEETDAELLNDFNRQITHGKIAIARGGFFGVGAGNSLMRDYVSLAFADSIFTIIVEEFGLFGGVLLIVVYMTLFFRAGRIAIKSDCMFTSLAVIGITLMMILQVLVNIAVVVKMIPVTGQGLPFIGHGGTSAIIMSWNMGILLALSRSIEPNEKEEPKGNVLEVTEEGFEEVSLDEEVDDDFMGKP